MKALGVPPLQTIFEINASSRDLSSQVMRAKREKDRKAIASFQRGRQERQERQEGPAGPAPSLPAPQEEQPEKEEVVGESVEVQALPWGPWSLAWGGGKAGQVPAAHGADLRALSHY